MAGGRDDGPESGVMEIGQKDPEGAAILPGAESAFEPIFQVTLSAPRRTTLGVSREESVEHPVLGTSLRRRIYCLARLYDPRVPQALEAVDLANSDSADVQKVDHPLNLVMVDGARPDPNYCLQRLRALWLVSENRSGELNNDPVLPFRHQAALRQFLTREEAPRRTLVADEVGLGKTVEAGLYIRDILRQKPDARIIYVTLGGLVENVLAEFQRLDLPRWSFFANIDDDAWKRLNADPVQALTSDKKLVVASIHKLMDSNRWQEQHKFLDDTRYDLVVVDECHTVSAYGPYADKQQIWFRNLRQLLQDHLAAEGRVLFLSATPHQGNRERFLNLVSLCVGTPLNAEASEKANAARGKVVFRIKEQVRDWEGKRIFPLRDVRAPILAEPPANYVTVLENIAAHFEWVAENATDTSVARAVGFVKSQALQYAASSLRAGFAYLLRRLIRYYPSEGDSALVKAWLKRLLPYRQDVTTVDDLLKAWTRELHKKNSDIETTETEGELGEELGAPVDTSEVPQLLALLKEYDSLFDDPEAGAKFAALFDLVDKLEEPVVIFSQAVDTVYELSERLNAAEYEVYRITGDMSADMRTKSIQGFRQSKNPRRMLVSSAAGGVGINLQIARIVVHFDLPWNPMALEQRVGRVHRIGSTRTILVETLLLRGSREAEVFQRITERLQEIVLDISPDPVLREALFRRILASLDQEELRLILSGEVDIDAVASAVDAGRVAVEEADGDMQVIAAKTSEQRGRAKMDQLVKFLSIADPGFKKVGSRAYAVLTEAEGGELAQVSLTADVYRFSSEAEDLVFDRTAASYLGLRRDQTGGIGHSTVDPLLRAAIDLGGDAKARSSTWLVLGSAISGINPGDVVYFALECVPDNDSLMSPKIRAWRLRALGYEELGEDAIERILWDFDGSGSRKAGEVVVPRDFLEHLKRLSVEEKLYFPIAAVGVRAKG